MKNELFSLLILKIFLFVAMPLYAGKREMKIDKAYLNIPISHTEERRLLTFEADKMPELKVVARIAKGAPDYWVFKDVSMYKGKTLTLSYDGDDEALHQIVLSSEKAGADSMYQEAFRPQFHFTTQRGWINDPNGLLYYNGEYHLFYQHNPYEREWGNMHWGHAVSTDLIHWKELPNALYPDETGTMFSGSAVVDFANTSGLNLKDKPALIAFYTVDSPERQVQSMAYSYDYGRTFTKYEGNPLIDTKEKWSSKDTRDPKVFWYAPASHWVMVLNERDGHSIFTSSDLKHWSYQSHVTGFWECPELFELSVDGDDTDKMWVMYGASGTYMLGSFDGKVFSPISGKHQYTTGRIYAAQTITDAPDNRRIQIGWGRIGHPGMPFNGMMLLPTELSLRQTKNGVCLYSMPVAEVEQLFTSAGKWRNLSVDQADQLLEAFDGASCLRVKVRMALSHATSAGLDLNGQRILDYDLNSNLVNGVFYSPEDMTSMEITADLFIDKTSVEAFIDNGAYSYSLERNALSPNREGLHFWGNDIDIKELEVFHTKSIW